MMASIFVHAIPQVEPPLVGVHLFWSGPQSWLYSPAGWLVQRRQAHDRPRLDCVDLTPGELSALRTARMWRIRLGMLTDRLGEAPQPLGPQVGLHTATGPRTRARMAMPPKWEVITLELDAASAYVRVRLQALRSFVVALRDGKVVAGGRDLAGTVDHELSAIGIDTVVVYAQSLGALGYCVPLAAADDWAGVPLLAQLQLPIKELVPALSTPEAELDAARKRLLPGEVLDADEFAHLAGLLRRIVRIDGPPRPIDLALLSRDDVTADFDELVALDPLRAALAQPKWRRALGFSFFDHDPTLVPGRVYEYRVITGFPAKDLVDRVVGFHTVPSGTELPADLFLGDVRFRFPEPRRVTLGSEAAADALLHLTRRGVALSSERQPFWLGPDLAQWSAVIDFPSPVERVELELRAGHQLEWAAGDAWSPWSSGAAAVPQPVAERVVLDFGGPREQLRLRGSGFLYAIRLVATPPPPVVMMPVVRVLPPVALVNQPRPPVPLEAFIANLQEPVPALPDDVPASTPPPRHELGFKITWLPAPVAGITTWPPDLGAPPPFDAALFQIEHHRTDLTAPWTPLLDDENYMAGHRDASAPQAVMQPGGDLLEVFPETRRPASGWPATLSWPDVFDVDAEGRRPPPPPETTHAYRLRAVDAIGRPSAGWMETNVRSLEKWAPPPVPVGPDPTLAEHQTRPTPTGVHVRVLLRGAPDLTAADQAILGTHTSAIILHWGWHAAQRMQDDTAREFRVYATRHRPDAIAARITAVTAQGPGSYAVTMLLERPIIAGAASGRRVDAGYPFEIVQHTAGTNISATLLARVPLEGGAYAVPRLGPVVVPVRLTPDRTRPPAWGARRQIHPITDRTAYESQPIYDLLQLGEGHPRDAVYVGVSCADAQSYVPDQLAPLDSRPGNESAIVPVLAEGRWLVRPVAIDAPALDPVPLVVAPEPRARSMQVRLDLGAFLAGTALAPGERVRLERVFDAEVTRAYRVDGTRLLARVLEPVRPGDAEVEVVVPNAGDRATILAALPQSRLEDRHVVFLAASHPYAARLFHQTGDEAIALPAFADTLPNAAGRWVYRARRVDGAGNLSDGAITLRGVVRVPSTAAVPPPFVEPRVAGDPSARLRLRVEGSSEVSHVLVFHTDLGGEGATLVRIPSAPSVYAKLRLADGTLLAPIVVPAGDRRVVVDIPSTPGERLRAWACTATRDGVVSPLAGPLPILVPPPPLEPPALTVAGSQFGWTWPSGIAEADVVLERSADGVEFERVSPRLGPSVASFTVTSPAGWQYRLRARHADGRTITSNVVSA